MAAIVDLRHYADALRNTGYKDLDSAVAEIIDNSIEANAKEIFVILCEDAVTRGRRTVSEIAFLDNGSGMDKDILESCLEIGCSNKRDRKGMGRFGVGLPQASMYACPSVEVYSWHNGIENSRKAFLDTEKLTSGEQTQHDEPQKTPIPSKYKNYLKFKTEEKQYDFTISGTLIVWKNCDNLNPRSRLSIMDTLKFSLGQKFRYYLKNGKHEIRIICNEDRDKQVSVTPNDPLFLLESNCVLASEKEQGKIFYQEDKEKNNAESLFEPYTSVNCPDGIVNLPIKYLNKKGEIKESNVQIKFSIVKEKFYDATAFPKGMNPGSSQLGKYVEKLEGISIVRADREIDFGDFDFYNSTNEPQHRWWGCEISFNPRLDEVFKVANNKQHVELKKINSKRVYEEEDEVPPLWDQLASVISPTIKAMYARNESLREKTRTGVVDGNVPSPAEKVFGTVEENNEEPSNTNEVICNTPPEELKGKVSEYLTGAGIINNPTPEDIDHWLTQKVHFTYSAKSSNDPAFDYDFQLGNVNVIINTNHSFYRSYLSNAIDDDEFKIAFELFLGAYAQTINETNTTQSQQNDRLFRKWQAKLNDYIYELQNPRE